MNSDGFAARPIKRETLADRLAQEITELILSGSIGPGTALPPEPSLAAQYGVSRSVVRDATRLLAARGLVEIRHGKGVFVTASQKEPFADAFLLALRRDSATVFDAEEFSHRFFPLVVSLATANATEEEINGIAELIDEFLHQAASANVQSAHATAQELIRKVEQSLDNLYEAIYASTHNKVVHQLSAPLRMLRRLRVWDFSQVVDDVNASDIREVDRVFFHTVLECLRSRDPERAQAVLPSLVQLPPEAVSVMRETPIGEAPVIQLESPLKVSLNEEDSDA